jgi:hypothetical protein
MDAARMKAIAGMMDQVQMTPSTTNTASFAFQVALPEVCDDGITRTAQEYIEYLLGKPIVEAVSAIQLPDRSVAYSFTEDLREFILLVT